MAAAAKGPAHPRRGADARRTGAATVFRRIGTAIGAAWQRSEREAALREAERRLRDAPDGVLSDIGIRPDDFACSVRHGRERFGWR